MLLQINYNENKVRNDNILEAALASSGMVSAVTRQWGEPEIFQRPAFSIDKFPKSPRSYCKYLQERKLRKNIIMSSVLVLMNTAAS